MNILFLYFLLIALYLFYKYNSLHTEKKEEKRFCKVQGTLFMLMFIISLFIPKTYLLFIAFLIYSVFVFGKEGNEYYMIAGLNIVMIWKCVYDYNSVSLSRSESSYRSVSPSLRSEFSYPSPSYHSVPHRSDSSHRSVSPPHSSYRSVSPPHSSYRSVSPKKDIYYTLEDEIKEYTNDMIDNIMSKNQVNITLKDVYKNILNKYGSQGVTKKMLKDSDLKEHIIQVLNLY